MSVDQFPPGKARSGKPAAQFVRYDEYIDKQIESTRRTVKAVDLLTALLTMAVGTLAFLFVAAAIEHWLVPGGFNLATRLVLFVALVLSLTFYTTRKLWPLLRGSINPAYAAQAIEHENPSLKNSLLNLLLFRQHRDDVTDAVYETLEAEAAHRLTRVPVDTAVDRTQLLRLGYALIAILAVVALYKILSPKDPFASAERLLMPWARIAAPSRVTIDNIEPGHVTLARGETLQVAADVRGISADDPVVVRFTTADGQAVDRPAPMKPNSAGLRFSGQLPPENDASLGVAQNLRYYIEAGDARSLEYKVTVVAAPTIVVERIDYDYPAYTGYEDRGVDRLGDIRAIEGTRVTIHARANQPIDEAAVDFEADGRRDVSLKSDGDRGQASFTLELRDDRQTPRFTSYALRFTGRDGRPNRDPVKFRIDVQADYPPEAAILEPADKTRDVRLDETVTIEVEARDPDFALGEVRLQGESAGRSVMSERLLSREHSGRFTGQLRFTPEEHGLHAGDVVRYWVAVRDNRTPRANETTTDSQTLRIVGPDPRRPPQDRLAQRDQREPQNNDQSQEQQGEGQSGQSEGQSQDGQSSETSQGSEQGESASADGESGQSDEQADANQSNENGTGDRSQDQSNDAQPGGQSSGDGQTSVGEQAGESGEAQQQPGGAEQRGDGQRAGEQQGSRAGSQSDSGSDSGRDERRAEDGSREQDSGSSHGGEDAPARDADDSTPVSSEGDNDADAFERIRKFLKREGQLPEESKSDNEQSNEQESQPGESASADGQHGSTQNSNDQSGQGDQNNENTSSDSTDTNTDPTTDANSDQRKSDAQNTDNQRDSREPSDQGQEGQQQPESGQPTQGQGESGAGNQQEQGQGAPESQHPQPTDQWQQRPSGDKQDDQQEPSSGGHGKRESDSQGDQGGDHAGGGDQGGGQQSNHDGTGSSGQNQSADEGAGESSEQGEGNNSMSGGKDAQADRRTGESSENQAGEGSQQREGTGDQQGGSQGGQQQSDEGQSQRGGEEQQSQGEQNEKPENGQGDQQGRQSNGGADGKSDAQHGGEDAPARDRESQQPQGSPNSGSNAADGAGKVPDGTMQPSGATGEAPEGDAANLEYARKQTDLVLETLAEQMKRQKVDRRLLDELGWTEADMKRFVERWQQLKASAEKNSPDANENQRELDDALRSLGLRPGQLQQSKVTDDQNRNLRQGYRGAIPLEYKERLKAYEQGVSRARSSNE